MVFVCWLLFGGGAEALASTTGRVIDAVRSWIVTLLTEAKREPARIAATPILALTEPARTIVPVPPVRQRRHASTRSCSMRPRARG